MKHDEARRRSMKDFALAAKLAREDGDFQTWWVATSQWRRLATHGELKKAPGYLEHR
jgi:hypothetical protein